MQFGGTAADQVQRRIEREAGLFGTTLPKGTCRAGSFRGGALLALPDGRHVAVLMPPIKAAYDEMLHSIPSEWCVTGHVIFGHYIEAFYLH